jgi:hypothetical protein
MVFPPNFAKFVIFICPDAMQASSRREQSPDSRMFEDSYLRPGGREKGQLSQFSVISATVWFFPPFQPWFVRSQP